MGTILVEETGRNTDNLVSIPEANRNFTACPADEDVAAISRRRTAKNRGIRF